MQKTAKQRIKTLITYLPPLIFFNSIIKHLQNSILAHIPTQTAANFQVTEGIHEGTFLRLFYAYQTKQNDAYYTE
jgi:hypothetical protein